jgi:hypothetical protein
MRVIGEKIPDMAVNCGHDQDTHIYVRIHMNINWLSNDRHYYSTFGHEKRLTLICLTFQIMQLL